MKFNNNLCDKIYTIVWYSSLLIAIISILFSIKIQRDYNIMNQNPENHIEQKNI